jgi:dolichol kinase
MWVAIPILYAAGMRRTLLLMLLAAGSLVALLIELGRVRVAFVGDAFLRVTRPLLRAHEHRKWSGATWLLLSFLLVVALFPPPIAIAAMWAVSVGDASAALVGRAIGGYRIGGSPKTLAGSVACAVVTLVGALFVADLAIVESVIGGLVSAVAEWPSAPGDDNIRIGLAVATGILLSHMAFS